MNAQPNSSQSPSLVPWDFLPPRLHVLFITGPQRTGHWLADALAVDSACEIELAEAIGLTAGMERLRDEIYDAVLISHESNELDALEFLEVVRTGSHEQQPVIVIGSRPEVEMTALSFEAGADAYICTDTTSTRTLIWHLARAVRQRALAEENRRLQHAISHQSDLEREEARRLLSQQHALIRSSNETEEEALERMPGQLIQHYQDLLRTYIIMGTGNLHQEMCQLAAVLAAADMTPEQVLALHLAALEEIIAGLGNRSARHVMNRADLMGLEVTMNLAEHYRRRVTETIPSRQQLLPGFDYAA